MCALLLNPSLSFAAHTQTRSNRAAAAAVQRKRQTPRRAAPAEPAPCRALALPAETPQIFLLQGVRRHYFSHGKSGVGIHVWGGEREKRERGGSKTKGGGGGGRCGRRVGGDAAAWHHDGMVSWWGPRSLSVLLFQVQGAGCGMCDLG